MPGKQPRLKELIKEARYFLGQGFAACVISPPGPIPSDQDLKRILLSSTNAGKNLRVDDNLGLRLGPPSNGLVVVELRCAEARTVAPELLQPMAIMTSGRESVPDSTWWFLVDDPPSAPRRVFEDPTRYYEQPRILEFHSTNNIAYVPPSIYPAGGPQGWLRGERCVLTTYPPLADLRTGQIPPMSTWRKDPVKELEAAISELSAVVVLARSWPNHNENDALRALDTLLRSSGRSDWEVHRFLSALGTLVGWHEAFQFNPDAQPARPTEPWNLLSKSLGPRGGEICKRLRTWLVRAREDPLPERDAPAASPNPADLLLRDMLDLLGAPGPSTDPAPLPPAPSSSIDPIREAARIYIGHGFAPIPLPPWSITPVTPGWQEMRVTLEQVDSVFSPEDNIGLLLGAPSNGLVMVDLLCDEARRAAAGMFPAACMISGWQSTFDSGHWFVVDQPPEAACQQFRSPAPEGPQAVLLEYRSTGALAAVSPSRLPADAALGRMKKENLITELVDSPKAMKVVEAPLLESAIREVAAVTLLARSLPRTPAAGEALVELLLGAGWDRDRCRRIVLAFSRAVEERTALDHLRRFDAMARRSDGHIGQRWSALARHLGPGAPEICACIGKWLSIPGSQGIIASPTPPGPADRGPPAPLEVDRPAQAAPSADRGTATDFVDVIGPATEADPVRVPFAPPEADWPTQADPSAYRGIAKEFVDVIDPASEADRVALLGQFLVYFGNIIGRNAYFSVEADRHYANENLVLIGSSSKSRKGTSHAHVHALFAAIDPDWAGRRVVTGIGSGAGLISVVRDPVEKQVQVKERGQLPRYETVRTDPGESDKRLLAYEPEFVKVLAQIKRSDNSLSPLIRQAWESGHLKIVTKNWCLQSSHAHVSIVSHITEEELVQHLHATEMANGFGNRFIWLVTRRSKLLPDGGRPDQARLDQIRIRLADAIRFARGLGEVRRDAAADAHWREIYGQLAADRAGLSGCLLGRAEAHTMRLALIYALLDSCDSIGVDHLKAAHSLWGYVERSVVHVFGDALGNPLAERLLQLLRGTGHMGLSRTEISTLLGRNHSSQSIRSALSLLHRFELVRVLPGVATGGRPSHRWFATSFS